MTLRNTTLVALLIWLSACGEQQTPAPAEVSQQDRLEATESPDPGDPQPDSPLVSDLLPEDVIPFWEPWLGDFDGMTERRVVRALTTYGGYQFYYDEGRPRGATYDMLMALEGYLNTELGRRNIRVYVLPIPVSRDQLLPALLDGRGDLIATDLTITEERSKLVDFTRPLLDDVSEVVVTGPDSPTLLSLVDLSGREIQVRASSSYYEHLQFLSPLYAERRLAPPRLTELDELLEAEDIVEMVSHGDIDITVMDDYKAHFWASVLPNVTVRDDLAVTTGRSIAWAHRKDSPLLAETLDGFLRGFGKGSLFGNETYRRYLANARRERCANNAAQSEYVQQLVDLFQRYGEQYSIDWLQLGAQAYQESGLRQDRRSPAGAVGIMQIKPSTAADRNVGINDVSKLENNIHAGTKYMHFIGTRYFSGTEFDDLNRWLFSLAAYNAGPAKINRYRREAENEGYDPATWFDNVEIIAARRIGRETVDYVSNIYKFYVGYRLVAQRGAEFDERFGEVLTACND